MGKPEIPSLKDGEYIHFEYVQAQRDHASGPVLYFRNMVEVADTREKAIEKATALLADEEVYAIHLRRLDAPVKNVHVYDETQPLAVAQNQAYRDRVVTEATTHAYGKLQASKHAMESEYERQQRSAETTITGLSAVIETLGDMLDTIRQTAQRDQRDAVYTDPADIYRLTKVDIGALRASENRKARKQTPISSQLAPKSASQDSAEEAHRLIPESAPEDGTGTSEDICVCSHPRRAHMRLSGAPDRPLCVQCADGEHVWKHEFELAVL